MNTSSTANVSISRRELFDVWRKEKTLCEKNSAVSTYVWSSLGLHSDTYSENVHIKQQINNFNSKISQKWAASQRVHTVFLSNASKWLDQDIFFCPKNSASDSVPGSSRMKLGRPRKEYQELSSSSKKRAVLPLVENYSKDQLVLAAETSLRLAGKRDAAHMVHEVCDTSPTRATKIKKLWKSPILEPTKYTREEALALFIDGRYTKHSYILMQSGAKMRNCNIYPSYDGILKAKKDCYPNLEAIAITETSAEVTLQSLIDHTITRLAMVQEEVLFQKIDDLSDGVTLIFKWGCDGSSGHSNYKQNFLEDDKDQKSDSSLFTVCIVPLQLRSNKSANIIWHNPRPSSTRFCRPIKLIFEKETVELCKRELENIQKQIHNILPTKVFVSGHEIVISSVFKLTMIDGKMFGVITDTSSQVCGICGVTPKNMNNLMFIRQSYNSIDSSKYEFGLSTLHAWIRCFECLLHIAYRQNIKKWQVRGEEEKQQFNTTKKDIQTKLRLQMGLLVDIPKPGYGTTNDGNTASRFFEKFVLASAITGIDEELIKSFKIILQTISCGYAVDVEAFRNFALNTAENYVKLYSWYYMPSSVHKLLIHGADIIKSAVLPIGMFSEEALEARNKDLRRYREYHTRKFSRKQTMTDLMNTMLFTSDPFISSLSKTHNSARSYNIRTLDKNVKCLLLEPSLDDESADVHDSDNISDSE